MIREDGLMLELRHWIPNLSYDPLWMIGSGFYEGNRIGLKESKKKGKLLTEAK